MRHEDSFLLLSFDLLFWSKARSLNAVVSWSVGEQIYLAPEKWTSSKKDHVECMVWYSRNYSLRTDNKQGCNGYRRRKWTRRHEFKSWTRRIAFHIALIPLGKVWIQFFSFQLWVNSRANWVLEPCWGN